MSALAMTVGGLASTTTPAAAVGGCPSGKLCLYNAPDYHDLRLTSTSTKACYGLGSQPYFMYSVASYVNNLPVNAAIWEYELSGWKLVGTIGPGKFSSNAGRSFGVGGAVCMGGVHPNVLMT
ncbi:peptidase inhibitor family I36 protein [Streptomyces sp. NRRL F-2580]|uniref:peptidase inhibitor family I36 protein n=1 Tax=Streptomyces sp. NRRL F-2580 TaxID=1463841 RepID=UPI000AF2C050|nr:peptidase inhibitor family I36 protein [Streptomyces sp. NRRL F-2580]